MLTESELNQLPQEAEVGLAKLIEILFNKYIEDPNSNNYSNIMDKKRVAAYAIAYCREYGINEFNYYIPSDYNTFMEQFWPDFEEHASKIHAKYLFKARKLGQIGSGSLVLLNGSNTDKIKILIDKIKSQLDESEIPEKIKISLHGKIKLFEDELKNGTTTGKTAGEIWLHVTKLIGEGFKNLEPLLPFINKIGGEIGQATKNSPELPAPEPMKELPAPDSPDDEIPF